MKHVLVIGEILVDSLTNKNTNEVINKVGGAPFNVAYNLASLGINVTFIGQVGDDQNGDFILNNIKKNPLLNLKIKRLKNTKTTIAKVVKQGEEVSYFFDRDNASDYLFDFDELFSLDYSKFDLVHIGSLMLSEEETYLNLIKLIKFIKSKNVPISFDVNLREDIYKSKNIAFKRNSNLIDYIDILKTSMDEIKWLTGTNDLDKINDIFSKKNIKLFITNGSKGAYLIEKENIYFKNIYKTNSIDFVGCGDSFFAGALSRLITGEIDSDKILSFANATGSLTSSILGALDAYKNEDDVYKFIASKIVE